LIGDEVAIAALIPKTSGLQMNWESMLQNPVFWSESDERIMPVDQSQKIGTVNHPLE